MKDRSIVTFLTRTIRSCVLPLLVTASPLADDPKRWPELYAVAQGHAAAPPALTSGKLTETALAQSKRQLASLGRELQMTALKRKRQIDELSQQLVRTPLFVLSFVEVA